MVNSLRPPDLEIAGELLKIWLTLCAIAGELLKKRVRD